MKVLDFGISFDDEINGGIVNATDTNDASTCGTLNSVNNCDDSLDQEFNYCTK